MEEPVRRAPVAGEHEQRPARSSHLGTGTLACPACDAPVFPGATPIVPTHPLVCPFCGHAAAARRFLSLSSPARPAHVAVRVGFSRSGAVPARAR